MSGTGQQRTRQLKWRCRRGMKELDVLLERFIQRRMRELEEGRWPELEALLDAEDDQLWDWLQNPGAAATPYRELLVRIRSERP